MKLGLAYARSVDMGLIDVCEFVKQACRRQLKDLVRLANDPLYYWDEEAAGRICRYLERLPHVKGPKAKSRELIKLEPWQCFVVTTVFGWRRKDTGGRRFRRVYIEVPRGNAKSTLTSGIGLYCTTSDGEEGAEVYSAATKREQAKIVFGVARQMMLKRPDFASKLGLVINKTDLNHPKSYSKFEPLSRDHGSQDGLNIHLGIIDELHAHKDRGMYDVLETGAGKRPSSMILVITTAGTDISGICYEIRTYVLKILSGAVEDDSQFGIIYTIDKDDDWTDPAVWKKANPNWEVSVYPDVFSQLAKKAMKTPSAQANFKTKHLNVWSQANQPWLDLKHWDACVDETLEEEEFSEDSVGIGLDLATRTDIASQVRMYSRWLPAFKTGCEDHPSDTGSDGIVIPTGKWRCGKCYPPSPDSELEKHYFVFHTNYLPEEAVYDSRNSQYEGWVLEGYLTETPGAATDFGLVKQEIVDFNAAPGRKLTCVCYDPYQAWQMGQELANDEGIMAVEVKASMPNYSAPMKELEALLLARKLHHGGSPAVRWMVSNVVRKVDARDNEFPMKERYENKIDGVVAMIIAMHVLMTETSNPYLNRGLRSL